MLLLVTVFQSTPGINAGRIVEQEKARLNSELFQSTPGINAGRIERFHRLHWR